MKLSISFSNLGARFKVSITPLLWVALAILLLMEGFVLRRSIAIMLALQNSPPPPLPNRSVRVNFGAYNQVVQRIDQSQNIPYQLPVQENPFIPPAPSVPTKK